MKSVKNIFTRLSLITAISLLPVSFTSAGTIADVEFPDQVDVGDKTVQLNGLGLRTATAFKVKVYAIGLYLENPDSDSDAIIASGENKRIAMHFLHKVKADELSGGWSEGFEANTQDISGIQGEIDRFNASMRDVKTGDLIVLDFQGDRVDVTLNDVQVESIEGEEFLKALLAIWLGPKPPNEPLREGILGR